MLYDKRGLLKKSTHAPRCVDKIVEHKIIKLSSLLSVRTVKIVSRSYHAVNSKTSFDFLKSNGHMKICR